MTDLTTALDAVSALIGERMKYESWIAALATRSDVPSHVLDKVRTDYAGRLGTVLQAFTAHVPALEEALADIQARDAVLAGQEQACRDDHAEGELRHVVGEYDGEQWEKVRVGHEALLTRLGTERRTLETELDGVQRSLGATADAAQRGRTLGEMSAPPLARAATLLPWPPLVTPLSMDSVVDAFLPAEPTSTAPELMRPPAALPFPPVAALPVLPMARTEGPGRDDEFGFLRITPRELPAEQSGSGPDTPATSAEESVVAPASPSASPESMPPTPTDAAKTLRCGECGTGNYPTEWYCERCGGELAAL